MIAAIVTERIGQNFSLKAPRVVDRTFFNAKFEYYLAGHWYSPYCIDK